MQTPRSPLDHFDYRTVELAMSAKPGDLERVSCHTYGGLGILRLDTWAARHGTDLGGEIWGIVHLPAGNVFSPIPVFQNIDNAANFVLGINILADWTKRHIKSSIMPQLLAACEQFDGLPMLGLLSDALRAKPQFYIPRSSKSLNGFPDGDSPPLPPYHPYRGTS